MLYVKRDPEGNISAVSRLPAEGFEKIPSSANGLAEFASTLKGEDAVTNLVSTDLQFIRVLEDVIELLIKKNIILFTELPGPAQAKMLEREFLRGHVDSALNLVNDEPKLFKNLPEIPDSKDN